MEDGEERNKRDREVCLCSRRQVIVWCVGVSLIVLLIIITLLSVFLTARSDASVNIESFPSGGDMLDFLLQAGEIPEKDGLYATWYHSANNKSEMNEALKGDMMILEADVTVEGYNTANETRIPIMAHPPDVYSDNTLEEWLDAVLKSRKGIKLDFKTISAVGPSLDLLMVKNQTGINRPVWLNADILPGPNVPDFWPVISASEFFRLIEQKFPDVTISPGWKVLYISIFPNVTYTRHMVEQMYSSVRHLQQNITFPVHALMARNGWPHLNWLLGRSSRFSLTLWQGKENPSVNDLLFIRDNSDPQSIYYDIYEPVLSQFKEAANLKNRPRRFYSGGDIVDYFRPVNDDGLNIQWETVSQKDSFLSLLNGISGAMLVILVSSSPSQGNIPVVHGSQPELLLRDVLESIFSSKKQWGLYFKIKTQNELDLTLEVLREAYERDHLHHPTWVSMDVSHGAFSHHGYITGKDFLRSVGDIFPFVTLAPGWPEEVLEHGYTPQLVVDMMELFQDTWQDVSLQLKPEALGRSRAGWRRLISAQSHFSLTLLRWKCSTSVKVDKQSILSVRAANKQRCFYNMPKMYREHIANLSEKHYPFFLQDL